MDELLLDVERVGLNLMAPSAPPSVADQAILVWLVASGPVSQSRPTMMGGLLHSALSVVEVVDQRPIGLESIRRTTL